METCKTFKDWILTDHIDGELRKAEHDRLEFHLRECPECREFSEEVQRTLVAPLRGMVREKAPEKIWLSLREQLESEKVVEDSGASFTDFLRGLLVFPRMAPIWATVAMFIVVGSLVFHDLQSKGIQAREQSEYLASLLESSSTSGEKDVGGRTPLEEFFL